MSEFTLKPEEKVEYKDFYESMMAPDAPDEMAFQIDRADDAPAEPGKLFVVNLSGRGDKDTDIYRENFPELDAADPNPKAV